MRPEAAGILLRAVQLLAWSGFLFLWVRLSLQDWKNQKILHRDLGAATGFMAAAYALLAAASALGSMGMVAVFYRWDFYRDLAAHLLLSCAAALSLWAGRIWPAGDAKLFMFLAALLPLLSISASFQRGGLFFTALVNVFLPACLFVFAQVLRYLWASRLRHSAGHLAAMGARRAADFALESARPALISAWANARRDLAVVGRPRELLGAAASWGAAVAVMAALSVLLKDAVPSPSLRTLLGFVLMIGWSRIPGGGGTKGAWAAAAAVALLSWLRGPAWRSEFVSALAHISVFGLFMMLGARWTLGAASGRVLMFVLPPLMALIGGAVSLAVSSLGLVPSAARRALEEPWLRDVMPLAGLGLFFGLSCVLVRIWEDEDRPEIPADKILSYMVLHPAFVERLEREEPDFCAEHFASRYADGLSERQARALRALCRARGWPGVWIQNTMSFAHWIFLGYFLTWLLKGHILERWL